MQIGVGLSLTGLRRNGAFSPSSLFPAAGIWYDQSDTTTAFQDTAAATPATASSDPVGRRNDKSGNARHALQATSTARPLYDLASSISSDVYDGFDDGYFTAGFAAASLINGMDCFIALKRNSTANMMLGGFVSSGGASYFGDARSAGGAVTRGTCGTPIYAVNGVAVPGGTATTQGQLYTALPAAGTWFVLDVLNLDLSTWTAFGQGGYSSLFLNGAIGGVVLVPSQSTAVRLQIRQYLAAKVGITVV